MILYAATIFLSAFLLFQVQPLVGKIIVPWFGGTAAVWSAALMFFQVCLLAGYAYAHALIRYTSARAQVVIHIAVLLVSAALLPIQPSPSWRPIADGDPTFRILGLLATTIGLPYVLLASTSPLLQAWYFRRRGAAAPYRLFALSNLGSLIALVSFPFLVEPALSSRQQAYAWSGAYVVCAVLCAFAAWHGRRRAEGTPTGIVEPAADLATPGRRPRVTHLLLWVALSACASALLVSVTNHLSQNIAPIPLLWVLPLAMYLATFILAFESDRLYRRWIVLPCVLAALPVMAYSLYARFPAAYFRVSIPLFSAGLFFCCLMCHGELARRRPAPEYLTLFYLLLALGGAVGGVFVAMVAPHMFVTFIELPVALAACGVLVLIVCWNSAVPRVGVWPTRALLAIAVAGLGVYLVQQEKTARQNTRVIARNFYGVLRVIDQDQGAVGTVRTLFHGTTNHGSQRLLDEYRRQPTAYYGEASGIGRALRAMQARGPVRYAVIGLGAGVLASYGRPQDSLTFFEINPLVAEIARTEFSFYDDSAADKRILMGDARLVLERGLDQPFDLIAVDAFSSDAIPVHLLTREALALYFRRLKPDGILALHISNRYLDLAPVCAAGTRFFQKPARAIVDESIGAFLRSSTWILITAKEDWFAAPSFADATISPLQVPDGFRDWTDDYSNLLQIMRVR